MNDNKNSIIRVVLILLASVSLVLAALYIFRNLGSEKDEQPQADLSGYGTQEPLTSYSDELYFEDDATVEMDSIPNDAVVSGADAGVASGSDQVAPPVSGGEVQQ